MENLKQKLLQLNIFEDNEWLNNYCSLIQLNIERRAEKYKTQKHHIIPRYYYEYNNLEVDNSNDNLVNLLYKDHILAHYYLALCSINDKEKYANECALNHIQGIKNFKDKKFITTLEYYQELYEHSRKCVSENMSGRKPSNLGKICINKDNRNLYIKKDDLQFYINLGYTKGNAPLSNEAKLSYKQMGNRNRGKARNFRSYWINNGQVNKRIYLSELENYLNIGWIKGKMEIKKNIKRDHNKNTLTINNGLIDKHIKIEELEKYIKEGWIKGSKIRNRICINNEIKNKYISNKEVEKWLDMGWKLGPKKRK